MNWIFDNKEWLFSGAGIALVASLPFWLKKILGRADQTVGGVTQITTVNVNQDKAIPNGSEVATSKSEAMKTARILFIDDQAEFPLIKILRKAGWKNVKLVADVPTFNSPDILDAAIIFVDIQGVGKALDFKDEGLGLAKALKTHFGKSKKVIIYSAEPRGDSFHDAWDLCDGRLPKTADPYQYLQLIENQLGLRDA